MEATMFKQRIIGITGDVLTITIGLLIATPFFLVMIAPFMAGL
jgi:hypothetical protein